MASETSYLDRRLEVFVRAGLIPRVPTQWQVHQGTVEMTPYVASTDATAERHYQGARFGHALVRQPLIAWKVGLDHFRSGSALGAKRESIIRHLLLTYHEGMPVFDLQVLQAHEGGLEALGQRIEELLANESQPAQRHNRFVALILPRASLYYEQFTGPQGWIARASRFEYPEPATEGSLFPVEFFSLVRFINYCQEQFPAHPRDIRWHRYPAHIAQLVGRRFREGRGFHWFGEVSNDAPGHR